MADYRVMSFAPGPLFFLISALFICLRLSPCRRAPSAGRPLRLSACVKPLMFPLLELPFAGTLAATVFTSASMIWGQNAQS